MLSKILHHAFPILFRCLLSCVHRNSILIQIKSSLLANTLYRNIEMNTRGRARKILLRVACVDRDFHQPVRTSTFVYCGH